MITILLVALGVSACAVVVAPAIMTFATVRALSAPLLVRQPSQEPPCDASGQWARDNDFRFVGNFAMKEGLVESSMSIWRRADRPTFFCRYTVQGANIVQNSSDFVTIFDGDIMLTTNNKADSQMLPQPPGYYSQSFSHVTPEEQWCRHVDMENYLMDAGGAVLVTRDESFEDCFVKAIRKQAAHVCSLPLWPLRSIHWFFVRRKAYRNLSVMAQRDRGWTRLPNELPSFTGCETLTSAAAHVDTEDRRVTV